MVNLLDISHGVTDGIDDVRAERLVDAAYYLLDEKGLEGLTIRAVLDRSGLARRAFYDSFASKDDLVLAVFEQTLRTAAVRFRTETESIADPLDRLQHIISSIVMGRMDRAEGDAGSQSRRGAALAREHMRLAEARPIELQGAISPLVDLIARIVREGIECGRLRQADASAQATLIYNLVSTSAHTQLLAEEREGAHREVRTRLVDQIWGFCERAIRAE